MSRAIRGGNLANFSRGLAIWIGHRPELAVYTDPATVLIARLEAEPGHFVIASVHGHHGRVAQELRGPTIRDKCSDFVHPAA